MDKRNRIRNFRSSAFIALTVIFSLINNQSAFASDNVLQAVQIDGVKDSYNIILRSDDSAELKKTIQAPNKMILLLKGIRASKSINTIYNNTANVDSVVVEPTGDDSVKILIQANNVDKAEVNFDTLKTPLGVINSNTTTDNSLTLSKPMQEYRPVYDDSAIAEEESGLTLSSVLSSNGAQLAKKALKNEKISWMITFGLFSIMLLSGMKAITKKDNDIKVGLSQSLKERELDLYRSAPVMNLQDYPRMSAAQPSIQPNAGSAYGIKAYQSNVRSPYVSSEIQRPRVSPQTPAPTQNALSGNITQRLTQTQKTPVTNTMQNTIQQTAQRLASQVDITRNTQRPKTTSIDSMKFLESMTKIYEKNGRTDLAQGLKTNMKKAKMNLV